MIRKGMMVVGMCLLMCPGAFSLNPEKKVTQYIIDSWTAETDLPQGPVLAILQTSDGYLWIGTEEGLVRFDGVKFTIFDEDNTPAMTSNYIRCLFEDSKKNLWIGTLSGGLLIYKNGQFKRFPGQEGFSRYTISAVHEDAFNNIWIGTGGQGLFQWNEGKDSFRVYKQKDGLPDNDIRSICPDSKGNLWVGTGKVLCRFKDNRFISCPKGDDSQKEAFSSILEDSEKNLWIGTSKGLFKLKEGKFIPYPLRKNSPIFIRDIFEDRDKNLWIATNELGLIRYYNGKFSFLSQKDGLLSNAVLTITGDREGNLWVGTAYGGLNRLKDGKFTTVTTTDGLSDDIVFSIYEDSKGYLWFGTSRGLNRYKNGEFIYFTIKQGLTHHTVNTICEDRRGFIWAGTNAGLNLLRHSKRGIFKINDYLCNQFIPAVIEDKKGDVRVGTLVGAIKIRDRKIVQTITQKDGLASNFVIFIYEDRRGYLWFSTFSGGVTRYKYGHFTVFTTKDGLASNNAQCIYEDAGAVTWIGTDNGLSRFKDGKFTSFTKKDGLFHDNIYQILEDGKERLWISTNKGIFHVDKKNLDDVAKGRRSHIETVVYNIDDGMLSSKCNGGYQGAGCKTKDGKLWFPTIKGAVCIDPEKIVYNRVPPPVLIEKVLLDGVSVDLAQQVVVRPGVKRLDIIYTALSFVNPGEVKFKFHMKGYNKNWNDAGTQRAASYTNLDPGNYHFIVTACNNDGLWNEKGASVSIIVPPPFRESPGFRMIIGLAIVVFSGILIYFLKKYIALTIFWRKQKYLGKYKLLEKIAAGGMGTVYKAVNLMEKSEIVAIKLLREEILSRENIKRFKQEAAIIDQLEHPNIVKVIERGQSGQNLFIAMEFLHGITLAQKIDNEEKINLEEALHIMIQISNAIVHVHKKNIIHRDLKPENIILIEKEGDANFVKLLDFGLAKTEFQTRLTRTGFIIGTISYMSPEQIAGKGVCPASDIFSLGTMFYEMVTGEKPFQGENPVEIIRQITDSTPAAPTRYRDDAPEELNRLIMRMLNKEINSRPNIMEVLRRLKRIKCN